MSTELAIIPHRDLLISPVMDLTLARSRMLEFQEFVAHYLDPSADGGQDGGDYGPIPGAGKKKVLLKSGADKLTELYGLYDEYEVEAQENFDTKLFFYKIKCVLKSRRDDSIVGTGVGSCSTYESKYRWRDSQRVCPKCQAQAIIKGKDDFGGGWLCWARKGGCGQKFKDGDASIEGQTIGRVENPDIMDTVNTVFKMAKKRAKIDAVIGVTRSSGIFTQDLEDVPMPPPKPEVQRTTEDIPLPKSDRNVAEEKFGPEFVAMQEKLTRENMTKSAASNKAQAVNPASQGPTHAAEPLPTIEVLAKEAEASLSPKAATLPDGAVQAGQAANFEISFKNALRKDLKKQATALAHEWLKKQGIVDGNGEPTAKAILADSFYDVREAAEEYARAL